MQKSPSIMHVNASNVGSLGGLPFSHHRRHCSKVEFRYFTEFTYSKGLFYGSVLIYVVTVCSMVMLELFLTDAAIHCDAASISSIMTAQQQQAASTAEYANPMFHYDPCRYMRLPRLLWLTREECSFGRRLLASVLLGGIVGWERRMADRPAGIRTMALVSLGACLFSINSAFGFVDSPMAWDASRVSAAIPSGVGFLGAGLIFKEADKDKITGDTTHVVHGLTTSASLWISSAIGVACAGQLYFSASFSVALLLTLLRFGPRQRDLDDGKASSTMDGESDADRGYSATGLSTGGSANLSIMEAASGVDPELQALWRPEMKMTNSVRSRASLGGIL